MSRLFRRELNEEKQIVGLDVPLSVDSASQSTIASWNPVLGKIDRDFTSLCRKGRLVADAAQDGEEVLVTLILQFKDALLAHLKFVSRELFIKLRMAPVAKAELDAVSVFERETADKMRIISRSITRSLQVSVTDKRSGLAEVQLILSLLESYHDEQKSLLYPLYLGLTDQQLSAE